MELAIGDPFPELISHDLTDPSNLHISSIYLTSTKWYLFKKAHFSHESRSVLDIESGSVILDYHHEGKNPHEAIDLLGCNESTPRE